MLEIQSPAGSMEAVVAAVQSGKKCFGMVVEAIPTVVPVLVEAMIAAKK